MRWRSGWRIRVGVISITVIALCVLLCLLWPHIFWTRMRLVQPAIVGVVDVDAGVGRDAWIVAPSGNVTMRIVFQPGRGLAKGVSILLRTYGLELVGSDPLYHGIWEETYQWIYTTIRKSAPETINVTLRIPDVEESRYVVRFWYAYTNEEPVSLANVTLLASYNASEYVPSEEETGRALYASGFVFVFLLLIVLLFAYWARTSIRS